MRDPNKTYKLTPLITGKPPTPISWVVEGFLERGAVNILFGASGTCKTFIAIDLACHIVAGRSWCGHRVTHGPVVYIAGEGRRGLETRALCWERVYGQLELDDREQLVLLSTESGKTVSANVSDDAFLKRLYDVLAPNPPVLIIFDTVARTFGLQQESNEAISIALCRIQEAIIEPIGCAVLAVHHTGKNVYQGARGGVAFECDSDAVFKTLVPGKNRGLEVDFDWRTDTVELICTKMKDAQKPEKMAIKAELVELVDGASSLVVGPTTTRAAPMATVHRMGLTRTLRTDTISTTARIIGG